MKQQVKDLVFFFLIALVVGLVFFSTRYQVASANVITGYVPATLPSPVDVGFGRGVDNVGDNYSEYYGIRVNSGFTLENVKRIGFFGCTTDTGSTQGHIAVRADASKIINATSTVVYASEFPSCTGFASTTPTSDNLTWFDFPTSFDFDENEAILLRLEDQTGQSVVNIYGTTTTEISGTAVYVYNCYGSLSKISTCITSTFGGSSGFPVFQLSDVGTLGGNQEINFTTQYDTRFTSVAFSTSTATTTITTGFYIDPEEATTSISDKNPTQVRFRYSKVPTNEIEAVSYAITDAVTPVWGNGTTTADLAFDASSTYDVTIGFANSGTAINGTTPFPLAYIYFRITTNEFGGIESTTTPEFYNAVTGELRNYQPCSITEINGCITNAGIFLFIPSNNKIEELLAFDDHFSEKIPFVYLSEMSTIASEFFDSESDQSLQVDLNLGFGELTLISREMIENAPYVNLLNTLISAALWVLFAMTMYKMALGVHNKDTTT